MASAATPPPGCACAADVAVLDAVQDEVQDEEVLDEGVLAQLGRDLGDDLFPDRLARTFLELLPGRVGRLEEAVRAGDHAAAMDAVLSLRVSSATVGLVELARHAGRLEDGLRMRDRGAQEAALGELPPAAGRARGALAQLLAPGSRSAR